MPCNSRALNYLGTLRSLFYHFEEHVINWRIKWIWASKLCFYFKLLLCSDSCCYSRFSKTFLKTVTPTPTFKFYCYSSALIHGGYFLIHGGISMGDTYPWGILPQWIPEIADIMEPYIYMFAFFSYAYIPMTV